MKNLICFILITSIGLSAHSQENSEKSSPYRIKPAIDIPVIIGGAGLSLAGLRLLRSKNRLDSATIVTLGPDDVNSFDRGATRQFQENLGTISNIALYTSFALPFLMNIDRDIRSEVLKVAVLYLETMAVMANAYVWTAGTVRRIRPYVFNPDVPFELKLRRGTTNSFFAGHPASAAASAFFAAKVFSDYHPNSKLKPYFWIGAFIPPAVVGYLRYKDGQHFPTDILVGVPVGAAIGILIPHLHKQNDSKRAMLYPAPGGLGMVYRF